MISTIQSKTVRGFIGALLAAIALSGVTACSSDSEDAPPTGTVVIYPELGYTGDLAVRDGATATCNTEGYVEVPIRDGATVTYHGIAVKGEWQDSLALASFAKDDKPYSELEIHAFIVRDNDGTDHVGVVKTKGSTYQFDAINFESVMEIRACILGA